MIMIPPMYCIIECLSPNIIKPASKAVKTFSINKLLMAAGLDPAASANLIEVITHRLPKALETAAKKLIKIIHLFFMKVTSLHI